MTEQPTEAKPRKKRRVLIVTALVLTALLAGVFLIWPYLIPTAWIEKAANAVIAGALEKPLSIGSVRVTRLGHIRMDEVVIWKDQEQTGPLVRWHSFDLSVKLLPLLRGQIAVEQVTVDRPELFIPVSAEGRPALDLPVVTGSGALGLLVGRAAVLEGTVTLLNPDSTPRVTIRHINFSGRLRSLVGPLTFRLSFSAPDVADKATVEMEGDLSLASEAEELTWEALRGRLTLKVEEFDWEKASTPPELKQAVSALPSGFVRRANVELTLVRDKDDTVDVRGTFAFGQLRLESQRGQPLELADASLSAEGRYEISTGTMDLKLFRFASPWLEAEFSGRLVRLAEGVALDGSTRGRLTVAGMPRSGREALASQGVAVEGPLTWEANLKASPERTAVSGTLGLEEAGVKVAGLELRRPGEPGRVAFDLERSGEPWTIHRLEIQAPEGSVHVVGKVYWRPPQRTSVDLRITSRVQAERLAMRWYELHPDSSLAVTGVGEVAAEATVRGLVGGLTMAGSLDATDALVVVGNMDLKSRGERAAVQAALELKKNTLLVRQAEIALPIGSASVRGKLPLDASRPRYDLRAKLKLNLDELQKRLDEEVLWLPAGVTVSGSAEASAKVNRFQQTLGLEAEIDGTALEVHWGLDGQKASGVPARVKLASNFERGVEIEELALQVGPAAANLAGQVAADWKSASLRYRGSVLDLSALAPLWKPLSDQAMQGGLAARGTVEWSQDQLAVNGSVDFQKTLVTLPKEPAVRLGLNGTVTHSPTSFSTEKLLLTVDDKPITLTAAVEREGKTLKVLSVVDAGQVDLTGLLAHLDGSGPSGTVPWGPLIVSAIKEGSRLHGRVRAEALKLGSYNLTNLSLEMTAARGAVQVPQFTFGINGGEAAHTLTVDLTGEEPSLKTTIDWKGLGADPNLRPFLDHVFPNLFVTGSISFSARYTGKGGDAATILKALEGTSTMVVLGGTLKSAPTPEETRSIFPTLTMSNYVFDQGHIETRTSGGRSHNVMKFQAPSVDTQITGWTDNATREIDYVVTVDLVENLGLGGNRDNVPSVLQSASRVEIAYIKGTLDNQRVEYLAPKVTKIKNTLKSLLGLKAIQHFLVGMSEEEKANYREGKVGGLMGAATQPFRYLKRKLKTQ